MARPTQLITPLSSRPIGNGNKHTSHANHRRPDGTRTQEIEKLTGTEADDGEEDISMMVLPDYSSGNNEKDIHVKNFNINVGGLELLDCADLKLAYGRKVGSVQRARPFAFRVFACVCAQFLLASPPPVPA